jgi:hypothetical protein
MMGRPAGFTSKSHQAFFRALQNASRCQYARRQRSISQIPGETHEDTVYTCLPGGFKMPQVTVYKPNGEALLSTNAKKFEQTKGGLILHLEGEHAKVYGSTMITTLPYVILCGQGC